MNDCDHEWILLEINESHGRQIEQCVKCQIIINEEHSCLESQCHERPED